MLGYRCPLSTVTMSKIISCFGNARATNLTTTARTFDLGVNFDEGRRFAAVGREEIQTLQKRINRQALPLKYFKHFVKSQLLHFQRRINLH